MKTAIGGLGVVLVLIFAAGVAAFQAQFDPEVYDAEDLQKLAQVSWARAGLELSTECDKARLHGRPLSGVLLGMVAAPVTCKQYGFPVDVFPVEEYPLTLTVVERAGGKLRFALYSYHGGDPVLGGYVPVDAPFGVPCKELPIPKEDFKAR